MVHVRSRAETIARLALLLTPLALASAVAQEGAYVVGAQDVLVITLWGAPQLSGKFSVEADGTLMFPLVGRIQAAGLTLREIEEDLRKHLADGFFKKPQVSVGVEQYRSRRIFLVGEVRQPGTYPLAGEMTLIEALARAGSTTADAKGEVLIVRPAVRSNEAIGPVLPDQAATSDVVSIDLRALQRGALSQNIGLRDGDTVFVPRAETVYVFGQVRNPGAYTIRNGTTLLQALSLAGGVTDRGATGRIKVVRLVAGQKTEIKIELSELIQPGDTIVVPEKFF